MLSSSDLITYQEKHDQQFPFLVSRTRQTLDNTSHPCAGWYTDICGTPAMAAGIAQKRWTVRELITFQLP